MIFYAKPNAVQTSNREVTEICEISNNSDTQRIKVEVLLELDHEQNIERMYLLSLFDKSVFSGFMDDINAQLSDYYKWSDNFKSYGV